MKAGMWYVGGFMVLFVYFYVYAVNYFRGVKADDDLEFSRVRRDLRSLPDLLDEYRLQKRQALTPGPVRRHFAAPHQQRRAQERQGLFGGGGGNYGRPRYPAKRKLEPDLSWEYHNYTSMTYFLRHVSHSALFLQSTISPADISISFSLLVIFIVHYCSC